MFGSILNMLWILNMPRQGSEYASSSEYTSVTQSSEESSPSYMFDRSLSIPWALNMLGLEYARVVNTQGSA